MNGQRLYTFAELLSDHMLCAYLLNHFLYGEGVSVDAKHMKMRQKLCLTLCYWLARSLACNVLHKMDTYSRMCDDCFD